MVAPNPTCQTLFGALSMADVCFIGFALRCFFRAVCTSFCVLGLLRFRSFAVRGVVCVSANCIRAIAVVWKSLDPRNGRTLCVHPNGSCHSGYFGGKLADLVDQYCSSCRFQYFCLDSAKRKATCGSLALGSCYMPFLFLD